ncbi:MAG: malonyl CoA-acyl carrier protein transacylase, partial [Spirochaetae bacterium HGW-Spirochaetae-6]
ASFLKDVEIKAGTVPVYANVTASPVATGKEKDLLVEQIYSPVKWTQTIQNMIKDGFDTFVEIGPGSVLKGLIKKIDREVTVYNVDSVAALDSLDIL